MNKICFIFLAMSLFWSWQSVSAEKQQSMDEMWGDEKIDQQSQNPGLKWFTEDKYAMFIHWGLYSEMAGDWKGETYYGIGEWIMNMASIPVDEYKAYAKNFNPDRFDAIELVRLAKAAGMKTIVITAKHHDGFAMFDSKASDFTVVKASPCKRDLMKELADACHAEGIRFGFYYSQNNDWTEPYGGKYKGTRPKGYTPKDFSIYFEQKVAPQVTELLTGYGHISVIWFDTPGGMPRQYSRQLVDLVKKHQPECLINSRIGGGYGDYVSLGDMHIPTIRPKQKVWETVDTTNNSWSYAWYDQNWKSPKTICERLISVVARGGSYMLNIGPKGDGTIPEAAVYSLKRSGAWLKAHGEAIYGAKASPFKQGFYWGDITSKENELYLHIFEWPEGGKLRLSGLGARAQSAVLLHDNSKLELSQNGPLIEVSLGSEVGRNLPLIPVIKLSLDAPAKVTDQAKQVDGLGPVTLHGETANTKGCRVQKERWMEKFGEWVHYEYVAGWQDVDAEASWDLNVIEPGKYMLSLEYACTHENAGSEWVVSSGDESITFVTYESGYDPSKKTIHKGDAPRGARLRNFTIPLGVLELSESGEAQLKISPRNLVGAGGISIKAVTLEPYR
ncbi:MULTISPECIES: alpha-L-fucosidase [unclassified Lentimonas]|uniref:alpha-L-fucosidase n=1 Tax=unclassified Lentimonas TaxID=2630993 RepID=UPI001323D334|nr:MULTISPECIES: alpha-L-fucosidase [unclassified Lentimonas]CAA6690023.1 Alpha-L-fucosidase (EC [Lentimonas sp. CC10]CAA6691099.1 Alpha-L-fucosidase (EC [Lentimonas sp. CC19]CAA7069288.1 Alpha-L-fucosidase (EC [Lentimonas sp. CC11]